MNIPPSSSTKETRERRVGGLLRTLLLYTRGIILSQHLRRVTMFYAVLVAMLMVFAGWEIFGDWLEPHQHFYRFAVYWMICGWLTLLSALLAMYDMLMLRLEHQIARRALRVKMLGEEAARAAEEE